MTQKNSWLAYTKTVLEKVSFDPQIFRKEFKKSLKYLTRSEIKKLHMWCVQTFDASLVSIVMVEASEYL